MDISREMLEGLLQEPMAAAGNRAPLTPLSYAEISRLSDELLAAEKDRSPVVALSERLPGLTQQQAYAIQLKTVQSRLATGARIVGVKAAFTNSSIQQEYGMGEPAAGFLFDSRTFMNGAVIPFEGLICAMVEAEIGCVLGEDLTGPGVTVAMALQALEGVMPAIEIVDLRSKDWKVTAPDITADSDGNWGVVLGGTLTPVEDFDLRLVGCVLAKNGQVVSTGAGAAALGNPAGVVAWAANKLSALGLGGLRRGQVVIPGSLMKPQVISRGDCFAATYDRLGSVTVKFE
jgi:2-keto-4-pentenoate hydratase